MKKLIYVLLVLMVIPLLTGCPGNGRLDKEAQEALWTWIQEQDTNGWTISGWAGVSYQGIVTDHNFRPARLQLAINADAVNPFHQRNLIEDIVLKWRALYPANMQPRFKLKVELYNNTIERANDLGFTEVEPDGRVDTHHMGTHDVN